MDRPPMHFGRRLAVELGYEIKPLTYGGFPQQVRGKRDKMEECFRLALSQAADGTGTVALVLVDDKLAVFVLIDAERARLHRNRAFVAQIRPIFGTLESYAYSNSA